MAVYRRARHIQPKKKRSFRWVTYAMSALLIALLIALTAVVLTGFPSAENSTSAGGQSTQLVVPQGSNPWAAFR